MTIDQSSSLARMAANEAVEMEDTVVLPSIANEFA